MKNLKTKKYIKWTLLLAVVVLIYGYTQSGWFGGDIKSDTEWLVVLHAGEAEIIETDGEMFIILSEISSNTVFFSDRPERKYQSVDTNIFLGQWEALFESSPPNAAMVHAEVGIDTEIVVIELFNPVVRGNEASFQIKIIGGEYTEGEIYKDVNLFIDSSEPSEWSSCIGHLEGQKTCYDQWERYPDDSFGVLCSGLVDRVNYSDKSCQQNNACLILIEAKTKIRLMVNTYKCFELSPGYLI